VCVSIHGVQGSVLVDFTVSRSELWGLWRCRLPDTKTDSLSIKQVIYADVWVQMVGSGLLSWQFLLVAFLINSSSRPTGWREMGVAPLPDSQLL